MDIARFMSCCGPGREEYDKKKRGLLAAVLGIACIHRAKVAMATPAGAD
jgi:hypothetical protein